MRQPLAEDGIFRKMLKFYLILDALPTHCKKFKKLKVFCRFEILILPMYYRGHEIVYAHVRIV